MSIIKHYPEHDKLDKVKVLSQAQEEFLEWLEKEKGLVLCDIVDNDSIGEYVLSFTPIIKLLAEYHHIDLNALELEKRQMLEELRRA